MALDRTLTSFKCLRGMCSTRIRASISTISQTWKIQNDSFKKPCCCQFSCLSTSRVSEDPGKEFACSDHQAQAKLCSLKQLRLKAKRHFSMFQQVHSQVNGAEKAKNSCASFLKWPDFMGHRLYSLTKLMHLLLLEVGQGNTRLPEESRPSCWSKWMESVRCRVLVQMNNKTRSQQAKT